MRLIDADALPKYTGYALSATEVAKAVENAPTIEAEPNNCKYWDSESHFCALRRPQAEPVRHGRWIEYGVDKWKCSECGGKDYYAFIYDTVGVKLQDHYCPFCGALMEE